MGTTTNNDNHIPIPTRSVYRLAIQRADGTLGQARTSNYLTPELAERVFQAFRAEALWADEDVVLVRVDQRLGGDGAWHETETTIVEVLS